MKKSPFLHVLPTQSLQPTTTTELRKGKGRGGKGERIQRGYLGPGKDLHIPGCTEQTGAIS